MSEREKNQSARKVSIIGAIQNNSVAVAVILTVLMMFIPITSVFVDIAMALNLAISLVILMTVIYTKRASDFISFPRVTLLVTLFGLAINVASTRLILTHPVASGAPMGSMRGQSSLVQAFAGIVAGTSGCQPVKA